MSTLDFFSTARKIQEAHALRLGLPVRRSFSDEELAPAYANLSTAEIERGIYGIDPSDESGCPLSADEHRLLVELNAAPMRRFRVAITLPNRFEQIDMLARTSCDAAVQTIQLLFSDADECARTGFKIKVEPVSAAQKEGA